MKKQVIGKETLRSSGERPKQKQMTREPFRGDVHFAKIHGAELLSHAKHETDKTDQQKVQQLF